MTPSDALRILQKDLEEERNWRSARMQLMDACTEFMGVEERIATSERKESNLRRSIAELEATRDQLQRAVFTLEAEVNGFEHTLAEKRKLEESNLADLRQERTNEEQRLSDARAQLAALKIQLNGN